jgi:hypothetical protein
VVKDTQALPFPGAAVVAVNEQTRAACIAQFRPAASRPRKQALGQFSQALRMMGPFLDVQSPGGLEMYDSYAYDAGGIRVGLTPRGRNAGFVMPGNHPSVHFMWLGALAMKVPVVVRPYNEDVFAPYRLVTARLEAGLPEDAVAFVPGNHDLVDTIVQACGLSVLFGMQPLADRYASNRHVKVHGPGRSKIVVLAGADFDRTVGMITRLVMDDADRGCINGSAVIVEGDARPLASAVAAVLERVPARSPLAENAELGAVRPAEAAAYNGFIDSLIGSALGHAPRAPRRGGRRRIDHAVDGRRGRHVRASAVRHGAAVPLRRVRAGAVAPGRGARRRAFPGGRHGRRGRGAHARIAARTDTIDKAFGCGALSTEFDPREPHEGFLLDFPFQTKAIRVSPHA